MHINERLEAMISLYLEASPEARDAALSLMSDVERKAFLEAVSWRLLMTDTALYQAVMKVLLKEFLRSIKED